MSYNIIADEYNFTNTLTPSVNDRNESIQRKQLSNNVITVDYEGINKARSSLRPPIPIEPNTYRNFLPIYDEFDPITNRKRVEREKRVENTRKQVQQAFNQNRAEVRAEENIELDRFAKQQVDSRQKELQELGSKSAAQRAWESVFIDLGAKPENIPRFDKRIKKPETARRKALEFIRSKNTRKIQSPFQFQ